MKLIKLELEGLNSFLKKTKIDFQTLFERGVFGIFGATGSGKSSILDGIFFALYGKVLRTKTEKEFINMKTNKASVKLLFEMREEGVDKIFEVSRNYRILANGTVSKQAKIYIVNGAERILLATGDEKTTEKIIDVIGFGHEEFQRFVALPQGQFAQFLKDSPKNKILTIANLFGLEKFGDSFSLKLKYEKSENEKRKEYLRGVLEQYVDVDENSIKLTDEKIVSLKKQAKQKANLYTQEKKKLAEIEKLLSLIDEKNEIKQRIKALKDAKKDFNENLHKLNVLKSTFKLAPFYTKLKVLKEEKQELENQKQHLENNITATSNAYFQIISANDASKTNLMVKLAELERRQSLLLAIKQDAERYYEIEKNKKQLEAQVDASKEELLSLKDKYDSHSLSLQNSLDILTDLDGATESKEIPQNIIDAVSLLSQLKTQKASYEQLVSILNNELEAVEERKEALIQNLIESDKKLNKFRKQLSDVAISLKENFNGNESAEKTLEMLSKEQAYLKVEGALYIEQKIEINQLKEKVSVLLSSIKEETKISKNLKTDLATLDVELQKAEAELKNLEYLKTNSYNQNFINVLKTDLKNGDICPVCQNRVDDLNEEKADDIKKFETAYNAKLALIEKMKLLRQELFENFVESNKSLEGMQDLRAEAINRIAYLTKKQKVLENKYQDFEGLTAESLNQKLEQNENVIQKLQALIVALNKTKDATYSKERVCVKTSAGIEEANKQEKLLREKILKFENSIKQINVQIKDLKELEDGGFLNDWASFEKFARQQNVILQQQKDIIPQVVKFVQLKEKSSIKYFNFLAKFNVDVLKIEQMTTEMKLIVKKLQNLNVKGFIDDEIATNLNNIDTVKQRLENINEEESKLIKEETNLKLEKSAVVAKLVIKEKEIENFETELTAQINLAGITRDQLEKEVVYEDITALEKCVDDYIKETDDARDDLDRIEKMIGGRAIKQEDLNKQQNLILSIEKEYVDIASEAIVLEKQNSKDKENINRLAYFKKAFEEVKQKEKYFEELTKLNKDDAILKFITEEYILNITEKANSYFATLTNGRYALLFNGDFIVVDNLNGGATRSIGTLSGGETFLASLAVAISIVETLSTLRNKPLDFVFLDEGFGTLDEDSKEMVMDAIRRLRKTNLVFGLITHEELVKFKTPTRIEVYKSQEEGSEIEIVL